MPGQTLIRWQPSYRIVASRFPPMGPYDRVASPHDLQVVYDVEGLTNPRLREEMGDLHLVAPEDRISGPGTTPIMAAFTHINRAGSRFGDGSYGVYYAARSVATAIKETAYHHTQFLRENRAPAQDLDMRLYAAEIEGRFHDVRGADADPKLYDPDDYSVSQSLGRRLRGAGASGIVYHSVRHRGGQCIAVFRPPPIAPCIQQAHYTYRWDGHRITDVYEKRGTPYSP